MSCGSAASFLADFPEELCDSTQQPRRWPASPRLIWHHNNFVSAFEVQPGILEDLSGIRAVQLGLAATSFAGDI
jgi:hypothetical protein